MPISVATYNVLASAYAAPRFYPRTSPAQLERVGREARVVERVGGLGVDVACLQEVEPHVFSALTAALEPLGYVGRFAPKTGKPDGVATFVRAPVAIAATRVVAFTDGRGGPASGHVALLVTVDYGDGSLTVANTHLKWDKPEVPVADRWATRQLPELLRARRELGDGAAFVLVGDLNFTPTSETARLIAEAGLVDVDPRAAPTCVANGKARKIDWLAVSEGVAPALGPLPPLEDTTPLPSDVEPSDHVPLVATLTPRDPNG